MIVREINPKLHEPNDRRYASRMKRKRKKYRETHMQLGGNSVSTNSKFVYVYTSTCTPFAFFGSSLGDHYDHMCNSRAWQKNGLKVKEKGAREKKEVYTIA